MRMGFGAAGLVMAGMLSGVAGRAQAPAAQGSTPPTGATARCNDGSYSTAKQKWQACGGHKGVQTWFAGGSGEAAASPGGSAPAAKYVPGAPSSPRAAGRPARGDAKGGSAASGPAAPGGGPGMVWVNQETKVYHCPGGKFYGKTKNGRYMSEADAKAAGDRPDHGRACGR